MQIAGKRPQLTTSIVRHHVAIAPGRHLQGRLMPINEKDCRRRNMILPSCFSARRAHASWGKESRMKANRFTHTLLVAALATLATGAFAAEPAKTLGQREYEGHCAVCHGVTGKGDGPYAGIIEQKMPDLSLLSKKNSGVFPVDRVYSMIDGSATLKAHGTRVMPIWGQRYRIEAAEKSTEVPYDDQAYVRVRINALIDYMLNLQVK